MVTNHPSYKEARKAQPNAAIIRFAKGTYWAFTEGWEAIGHPTAERRAVQS